MAQLPKAYQNFKEAYPTIWQAYDRLGAAVHDSGPIDKKIASCSSWRSRSVLVWRERFIHIRGARSKSAHQQKRSAMWCCSG